FVPIQTMPGWLQAFAKHQPVSLAADAARGLMEGKIALMGQGNVASTVVQSLAWCIGLLIVLAPLAVRRYRRIG
ncbi:MAG TPA: ABC transporter permease, partial [Acidimicrobiales bacterium]|nr:ABC transporter permease [Acidimicrobiales bacterium]